MISTWSARCLVALAFAELMLVVGCRPNSSVAGSAGKGGEGGSGGVAGGEAGGDACAPTAGAGGAVNIDGCPTAYILDHYDGDTCGLCDPGISMQCSALCDWGAAVTVECSPDGTTCGVFPEDGGFCECGWRGEAACPALFKAAEAGMSLGRFARACVSDNGCGLGHHCDVRIANRMFCDIGNLYYAKDYCPDAGTDSGADGADAGVDSGDAGADAADGGT